MATQQNAGRKANQLPYRISETRRELADDASAMAGPAHELTVNQRVRAAAAPDTRSRRLTAAGPVAHRARPARLQKMPKSGGFQPAGTPQMSRQRQTAVWGRQRQKKMEETQQHLLERLDSMTEILQRIDAKGLTESKIIN